MTLDAEDIEAIADAVLRKQREQTQRYPETMTTKQVAAKKGCCTKTVLENWRVWGLRRIGRGRATRFCGVSVERHVEGNF